MIGLGFNRNNVNLVSSFLSDRFQCVRLMYALSSYLPSSIGSPQGPKLGHLLWLFYVNDSDIPLSLFLSCSQSIRLGLFYGLGFDLVAVLHATLVPAKVCQEIILISLHFMFLLATSLNLSLGIPMISFSIFQLGVQFREPVIIHSVHRA